MRTLELTRLGWVGVTLSVAVIVFALVGPWLAPHPPNEIMGAPYALPSGDFPLGTDFLGRDGWSRFLAGGRSAVAIAFAATVLGAGVGAFLGLLAAYLRGLADFLFGRTTEVLMAFPSLILILLLLAGGGTNVPLLVVAVALASVPRIARLARSAALAVRTQAYIDVAIARGERAPYIVLRELLPNVLPVLAVDFALRFAGSIVLVASVSFLGVGLQPPKADWGLIVSENAGGLTLQPWLVVAPVVTISLLLIGVSIAFDGLRRRSGLRSWDPEALTR